MNVMTDTIEHSVPVDVERLNAEYLQRSLDFTESLDDSRWLPKGTLEIPINF